MICCTCVVCGCGVYGNAVSFFTYTLIEAGVFVHALAQIRTDAERAAFVNRLAVNPDAGDVIPETTARGCSVDKAMEQFQRDLLKSVRQTKTGKIARKTRVALSPIAEARSRLGMSQAELADLMGVSPRTLQDWEQGRRKPTGAAQMLLRVAIAHPEALLDLKAA